METRRELGIFDAVMMGLGGAIGFEIFVLLDYAYFHLAGSGIVLALLLCGLINLLTMLSYCELGAAIPEVGGEYTYTKAAFGGIVAFMSGWLRWLASVFGGALAAIVFAQQFLYLLSLLVPAVPVPLAFRPLIPAVAVILLGALSIRGVKEVGTIIVGVFLAIFAFFIIGGLWYSLTPGLPPEAPSPLMLKDLPGVFAATAYTTTMFLGMRALVAGAPQIRNPGKNVPRAMLLSALIMMAINCGVAYVAVMVASRGDFVEEPLLNFTAEKIMGDVGGILFAVAGIVASLSSLSTAIMVQSSITRGLSRDGYLPKVLLSVHRRFRTPHVAIIANSIFIMLFGAIGAVEFLGYAASFGSMLVFALVNLSLMRLRKKRRYLNRPFKAPLYPFTPIVGIVMSLILITVPVFLKMDFSAIAAFMVSVELLALALILYYLRMLGRYRLRVAVGGVSLGMGGSMALLAYLIETGFVPLVTPRILLYALIFVSAVSILGGALNVSMRKHKTF